MKTIGLIGGTTWHSSAEYYKIINQQIHNKLGKNHSAKCILYSLDFEKIYRFMAEEKWDKIAKKLIKISRTLEASGAECILICTNTLHIVADIIEESIVIPLINICLCTANKISQDGINKIALLGTKFTMEQDFFKEKIATKGILTITPDKKEREFINDAIFNELGHGIIKEKTKIAFKEIIENLKAKGAKGIVLGCTEIPLLIKQSDFDIPIYDTTSIHANSAVDFALL
ncbi:MAG: aspartate/glutamate racemase family protein [Bacteroidales bacterium]|nr:aspartate/glutamate racemase family protein [Bacteroidales bacterium]